MLTATSRSSYRRATQHHLDNISLQLQHLLQS